MSTEEPQVDKVHGRKGLRTALAAAEQASIVIHGVPLFLCSAANKCRAGAVRDGRMRASGSVMIMLISN